MRALVEKVKHFFTIFRPFPRGTKRVGGRRWCFHWWEHQWGGGRDYHCVKCNGDKDEKEKPLPAFKRPSNWERALRRKRGH